MEYYCRLIWQNKGGYTVEFPDIPGAITEGETIEESLAMAKQALNGVLSCDLDCGLYIPISVNRNNEGLTPIEVDPAISKRILESKISALQKELEELEPKKPQKSKKEPALV